MSENEYLSSLSVPLWGRSLNSTRLSIVYYSAALGRNPMTPFENFHIFWVSWGFPSSWFPSAVWFWFFFCVRLQCIGELLIAGKFIKSIAQCPQLLSSIRSAKLFTSLISTRSPGICAEYFFKRTKLKLNLILNFTNL